MPLGLLGQPGAPRARVALRGRPRLAARHDRAARGAKHAAVGRGALGGQPRVLPAPLRHAVLADAEGAARGDRARLPGNRRSPAGRPGQRLEGAARPLFRQLHDASAAGRRPHDPRRAERRRARRRRDRGPPRRSGRRRGVRARPGGGPICGRHRGRGAGQDRRSPTGPSATPRRPSSSSSTASSSSPAAGSL